VCSRQSGEPVEHEHDRHDRRPVHRMVDELRVGGAIDRDCQR
jgi:hypothetical protein